ARGRGEANAAKEGPGGAVDRKRQGVDQRTTQGDPADAAGAVGVPCEREQDTEVSERQYDDTPAFDHARCKPCERACRRRWPPVPRAGATPPLRILRQSLRAVQPGRPEMVGPRWSEMRVGVPNRARRPIGFRDRRLQAAATRAQPAPAALYQ